MYRYFMGLARRVGAKILDAKEPVGVVDRLLYRIGDLCVYGPLRNVLGMSRVRIAYTAGEAIGPDLFVFYRSIGINLKQLYGSTETSVFVCVQPNGQVKADTVGPPVNGVELKVTARARDPDPLAGAVPELLQESRRRPRRRRTTTAGSTPATPATSTRTATSRSSTARRTSGS